MWTEKVKCRGASYCPITAQSLDNTVFLIWDYHTGGDLMPCVNARKMHMETAMSILRQEAEAAVSLGRDRITVRLLGGDPFHRLAELKRLCSWAWEQLPLTEIRFVITVSVQQVSEEAWSWYLKNRQKIRLWIRWDEVNPDMSQKIISEIHCGVEYTIDPRDIERAYEIIIGLLEQEVPLRLLKRMKHFQWTLQDLNQYEQLLKMLEKHEKAKNLPWVTDLIDMAIVRYSAPDNDDNGVCYDTNGYVWTCPKVSHYKLQSWSMNSKRLDRYTEKQPSMGLQWICPGEVLEWEDPILLKNLYMMERICGLRIIEKMGRPDITESIKEILIK